MKSAAIREIETASGLSRVQVLRTLHEYVASIRQIQLVRRVQRSWGRAVDDRAQLLGLPDFRPPEPPPDEKRRGLVQSIVERFTARLIWLGRKTSSSRQAMAALAVRARRARDAARSEEPPGHVVSASPRPPRGPDPARRTSTSILVPRGFFVPA
ncbi:MAG TPA: hypothetical protein VNP92_25910 [Actinophytocola sp.]|nr:hypothetical protein [Actinophytocola sp.]